MARSGFGRRILFKRKLMNMSNKQSGFISQNLLAWTVCLLPMVALTATMLWQSQPSADERAGLCEDRRVDQLLFGVVQGDLPQVRRILARGVDVNRRNEVGVTPLIHAAIGPNAVAAESVRLLIEAGAEVDRAEDYGSTPLMYAVTRGNDEAASCLLAAGADPNAKSHTGVTALHAAAGRDDPAILRVLLQAGADPSARDLQGSTPLDYAVECNNAAAVTLLATARATK
jgi:ankyrin repeat protein